MDATEQFSIIFVRYDGRENFLRSFPEFTLTNFFSKLLKILNMSAICAMGDVLAKVVFLFCSVFFSLFNISIFNQCGIKNYFQSHSHGNAMICISYPIADSLVV